MAEHIPKVSVGIPVYNGEDLLAGALENLAQQDFEDIEFIVVDNASTDNTEEIYREFARKDSRFRVYRFTHNNGAARNFLRAYELARSPYFMWAAHDDRREPSCIRRCLEVLESDPEVVLAYTHSKLVDNDGNLVREHIDPFDLTHESAAERFLEIVGRLGFCNLYYGLFRSTTLTKIGFLLPPGLGTDALQITELLFHGKIVQIPEPLFIRNIYASHLKEDAWVKDVRAYVEKKNFPLGAGVTLPYLDYICRHVEIVRAAPIEAGEKPRLVQAIIDKMARGPAFNQVKMELDRAIALVGSNRFYEEWNPGRAIADGSADWERVMRPFYLAQLLRQFEDALVFYPGYPGIQTARAICLAYQGRLSEAQAALEHELKNHPGDERALKVKEQLEVLTRQNQS